MPRNRFLFDLIGLITALGVSVPIILFTTPEGIGGIAIFAGGVLGGGLLLGFFSYKNDGVKIAAIFCGLIAIAGIGIGILMITGGTGVIEAVDSLTEALVGPIIGVTLIVLGIIFMVTLVITGGLLIAVSAIGSAIGEAVWKDKQNEKLTQGVEDQPYKPIYQPTEATKTKPQKAKVCPSCGVSNVGQDSFCTNCGSKL